MIGKTNSSKSTGTYQSKSVTISSNTTTNITADVGYDALSAVTVETDVQPTLQAVTGVTPSTSSQTITADLGYDGLSSVQIDAMTAGSATTPATTITSSPSISVNSSSGLITSTVSGSQAVTPVVVAGYVASGTSGTVTVSGSNTHQLSTKSAQTYYVSSTDRTITSGRYLTGNQTIKAVVTSGITASNVKKGSVISVGDSTKSDRIISVTGTYEPTLETVSDTITTNTTTTYTPSAGYDGIGEIEITTNVQGSSVLEHLKSETITSAGTTSITPSTGYDAMEQVDVTVASGSATTPATTITANPTISVDSSTGEITATTSASQSITPTVSAGYVTSGTAGTVSVSGSGTEQLTTQGATTYNTATADQIIPAGTFLTGNQTIRCVTTSYLTANNIKAGVTVKVGDFGDSGRIKSVTGTYTGANSYTLLGSTSITTSSTSTTAASIGTLNLGSSAWDASKIIYVRIRGSRGKYSGYFYGSDSFLLNGNAANSSTTNATVFSRTIMRYYGSAFTVNSYAGTTCYGIYPYSLSSTGVLNIYRRYNSSISGIINDTFTIQAYLLDTPDGVSPFA